MASFDFILNIKIDLQSLSKLWSHLLIFWNFSEAIFQISKSPLRVLFNVLKIMDDYPNLSNDISITYDKDYIIFEVFYKVKLFRLRDI